MNSKQYEAAITVNNKAIAAYRVAQAAYRTMLIGDDEFIAARKVYSIAMAAFDAAVTKEIMDDAFTAALAR